MNKKICAAFNIAVFLAAVLLAACGTPGERRPLLDERYTPDILTESRSLAAPPSMNGNRFVHGWRFMPPAKNIRILPQPAGARLEIPHLDVRSRTLRLTVPEFPEGGEVALKVAGRDVGTWPLANTVDIPLPGDMPVGRVALDLAFTPGTRLALDGAGILEARRAGDVELKNNSIVQAPWSMVDLVRDISSPSVLHGRFVPPDSPEDNQAFSLTLENADGPTGEAFRWSRADGTKARRFKLSLNEGLVRLRLSAQGSGDAGRWEELELEMPAPVLPELEKATPASPQVVVVYVLDALQARHVDHLGGTTRGATPAIDQLAREGITLTRHFSVAPNTTPSTKSFFTGQYYFLRGADKLPADGPATLAELFTAAGYRTGGFSGNGNVSRGLGTIRGFERFARRSAADRGKKAGYNNDAERVQNAARQWLDSLDKEERVFLYVHTIHPHNPFNPPASYKERFATESDSTINGSTPTLLKIRNLKREVNEADKERLKGLYAGGLAYNDDMIRPFLDEIIQRYPPGEVLVVLTSDHGEELFEHDGILHGYTLYDEMLHIPLVFWWPGRLEPGTIHQATDNLDLHKTLRELIGAEPTDLDLGESRSLWNLLEGREFQKPVRFAAAASVDGGIFMARSENAKLIWAPRADFRSGMGAGRGRTWDAEYFFDLEADPGEHANRAGGSSLEAAWLRSRLLSWMERGMKIEVGEEAVLDESTRENLRALGYIE